MNVRPSVPGKVVCSTMLVTSHGGLQLPCFLYLHACVFCRCELFTIQLKDSVLSLASMKDGKTFAGLADGTLVVFEVRKSSLIVSY